MTSRCGREDVIPVGLACLSRKRPFLDLAVGPWPSLDQHPRKDELAQRAREEEHVAREPRDAEHEPERAFERNRDERAPAQKEERRRDEPEERDEGARPGPLSSHARRLGPGRQGSPEKDLRKF